MGSIYYIVWDTLEQGLDTVAVGWDTMEEDGYNTTIVHKDTLDEYFLTS